MVQKGNGALRYEEPGISLELFSKGSKDVDKAIDYFNVVNGYFFIVKKFLKQLSGYVFRIKDRDNRYDSLLSSHNKPPIIK